MQTVTIGPVDVSRLCMGGNPISGFSHQGDERSREMLAYYTPAQVRETLHLAESLGVNTLFARTDEHVLSLVKGYWDDGGTTPR